MKAGSTIAPAFSERAGGPVTASGVEVLQINLGYRCNLECRHCHVQAGPQRGESMSMEVMEQCLRVLARHPIPVTDITGGSPELHPAFRWFLGECASLGRRVLVRSNGAVLLEEGRGALMDFYAERRVEVVLSLPHVEARPTDSQRGAGVFARVVEAMRLLNERGYGREGTGLMLHLVHNPAGAYLPGPQPGMESLYRKTLEERHGVRFNNLFCLTNMPVGRCLDYLVATGNYEDYMKTLVKAFNPAALAAVMCRSTVSVGWDGSLYDCDFNQMLGLTIDHGAPRHISAFEAGRLARRRIVVGDHCYGCTAGAGSSCQGQTA